MPLHSLSSPSIRSRPLPTPAAQLGPCLHACLAASLLARCCSQPIFTLSFASKQLTCGEDHSLCQPCTVCFHISEPSSCPIRAQTLQNSVSIHRLHSAHRSARLSRQLTRGFSRRIARRCTPTTTLSKPRQYRKAGAPINLVGPRPRPS